MQQITIGRKKEKKLLQMVWESNRAEFMAVYGRRRVGKTHLIREFFCSKGVYFEFAGMRQGSLPHQLANFMQRFRETFGGIGLLPEPKSWQEALGLLTREIDRIVPSQKVILFFDELPWIAQPKSGFVQALDYYWNGYWSRWANLKLITCGSAASWMLDHLINAKGGLHNRITRSLLLNPLSLGETEEFLHAQGMKLKRFQVLDLYLILGGIPHYLLLLNKSLSIAQNIDALCFQPDGLLRKEFDRVFKSLFKHAEEHELIIREIAKKRYGISRVELLAAPMVKKAGLRSGGTFNKRLEELEAAGFIRSFISMGAPARQRSFCVSDEYASFFLRWIEGTGPTAGPYWAQQCKSPQVSAWMGTNFEQTCFKHLPQIRHALSLDAIACRVSSWSWIPRKGVSKDGAQIDLLLDRDDNAITLCEVKYSREPFTIDKSYARQLLKKTGVFEEQTGTSKQLFFALITTCGVRHNSWFRDLIDGEVTLDDLFR